ncbi:Phosphate regulon transcriptional regulatory protein phoB [Kluyvera cryocrescens]|uniref:Phosphate regulon transcriptional regulatory protein phoB n=1 Tax=Kluyvera cryocrescens TaxID=580 RepID=A0A485D2T3_KLUCR|nr:Phosphate regulon transcriptional regulatory protein phoB [Kluyvera cryocrescens]
MTGENPLDMGPTEFKLLHFFMTHPERVYSREQLLNHVWGTNVYVEDRTVDVHIRRLRKALEHSGHDRMVQTVRGTGLSFFRPFLIFDRSVTRAGTGCHGKGWPWSYCYVVSRPRCWEWCSVICRGFYWWR